MITRAQWKARDFRPGGNAFAPPIEGATIHWEGTKVGPLNHADCAGHVRQIQAFHMDTRGWTDIAYNLLVCRHGGIFEGRGRYRGNGANGDASNAKRYSVCAIVGEGDDVPAALLDGLADAVNLIRSWGAGRSVDGHRDHQGTSCPGDTLYAWLRKGIPTPLEGNQEVKLTDTVPGMIDPDGSAVTVGEALARVAWLYAHRNDAVTALLDPDGSRITEGEAHARAAWLYQHRGDYATADAKVAANAAQAIAGLELRLRRLEAASSSSPAAGDVVDEGVGQ